MFFDVIDDSGLAIWSEPVNGGEAAPVMRGVPFNVVVTRTSATLRPPQPKQVSEGSDKRGPH